MLKSANYVYIVTRAHGLSTHLIKENDLKILARTPSFEAFLESMMRGDYAEKIGLLSREKINVSDLNKVFSEIYVERLIYLIKIAGSGIKKFLDSFTRRVEVENIRRIIRAKFHALDIAIEDLIPLPRTYSVINYQGMIEAETLEDSLSLLGFSKYRDVIDKVSVAKEIDSTIPLEAFLDTVYYKEVLKNLKRVPDEKTLKDIVGTEIDLRNIYYIVSYKILDVPQRIIEESIIKPFFRFREHDISSLVKARREAIAEVINSSGYQWIMPRLSSAIEEDSIDILEFELAKIYKNFIDKMAIRNALGMGYVVSYLFNIEYEYRNLSAISIAKKMNLKESDIRLIY